VNTLIGQPLSEGLPVKVVVGTLESLDWRGLPVHTTAGLEDGLIQRLRPVWNITERPNARLFCPRPVSAPTTL
jgi:hypothetical protein